MYFIKLKPIAKMAIAALTFVSCKDAPEADFSFSVSGNDVDFTKTSSGDPETFSWDFGDGETSTIQNIGHTYAASGDYTVTLEVAISKGKDRHSETVTVEGAGTDLTNYPDIPGADGMCVATNTSTWQNGGFFPIKIKVGSGIAFFNSGGNTVSAGSVSVDGNEASIVGDNI